MTWTVDANDRSPIGGTAEVRTKTRRGPNDAAGGKESSGASCTRSAAFAVAAFGGSALECAQSLTEPLTAEWTRGGTSAREVPDITPLVRILNSEARRVVTTLYEIAQ